MAIGFPSVGGTGDVSNATGSSPTNRTIFTSTFGSNYANSDWTTFNDDGTKFYAQYRTSTPQYGASQWDLTTPYDLSTATNKVDRASSAIGAFAWQFLSWKDDGTKAYMAASNGGIAEYACNSAFDISGISTTISFTLGVSGSGNYESIWWKPDGTKLYANKAGWPYEVIEYTLSSPWSISTASASASKLTWGTESVQSHGIALSPDGTKIYLAHNLNSDADEGIWQYDMSTPWDISTVSFNNIYKSTSADGAGYPSQMHLSADGTRIFFQSNDESGSGSQAMFEYVIPGASPSIFTFNNRSYQYNSNAEVWERYTPLTVAQTGLPITDLSDLNDSTNILKDPANEILVRNDIDAINAIATPSAGQLVFKIDTSDMYVYDGTEWKKVYDQDDVP